VSPPGATPGDSGRSEPRLDLQPVGGPGRPPTVAAAVLALVAAGLVLAVLKPWTVLEEPIPTHRPAPTQPAAVVASASPADASPVLAATPTSFPRGTRVFRCLGGRHWTLVTDETQGAQELPSWTRVDPLLGATGPDDPAIPWERVGADAVRAIGVCLPGAPSVPGASPDPETVGATIVVRRPRDPAWPARWGWEEVGVVPWTGEMAVEGGAMVAPGPGADGGVWAVGDYVVEVRPAYVGPSAWFGVRIAGPTAGDGSRAGRPAWPTAPPGSPVP